jgi:prevent-host-death family protein
MRKVGSRELKDHMGRYMRAVRRGQTLLLTDHGKVFARVSPEDEIQTNDLRKRLREMEAQGLIRLAIKPFKKFHAVKSKGKPVSQTIIEDRR